MAGLRHSAIFTLLPRNGYPLAVEVLFDIGLRQLLFLLGDTEPNTPNEFHTYLENFPDGYAAADKRASALADYAGALPEDAQMSAFNQLSETTLNGRPIDAATEQELLTDTLAFRISAAKANDPKQHLDAARDALRSYRPSAAPSSQKAA